jgi:chromosome partitioning protein
MARRIMIDNHKGGVGKTAETVLLAWALALEGLPVLVVDLDPQGNVTTRLGVPASQRTQLIHAGNPGIAGVLRAENSVPLEQVLIPCGWDDPVAERITIAPSLAPLDLKAVEQQARTLNAEHRLRLALNAYERKMGLDGPWYVLFDKGPTLMHLADLAMVATDNVLLTSEMDRDSLSSATQVVQYVADARKALDREDDLEIIGVVPSNVDGDSPSQTRRVKRLGESLPGIPVWETVPSSRAWHTCMDRGECPGSIPHAFGRTLKAIGQAHARRVIALDAPAVTA